jgi:transposase
MSKRFWAGLDVGVETTSDCVIDDDGEILHEAVCPTDVRSVHREIAFLRRRQSARVALESGNGMSLARGLQTLGYKVDLYEARQLSKFLRVRRSKTDAGDALGIAHAGRIGASLVSKVHLKSFECQALTARLRIRRHLIRSRVAMVNLLCRQLEQFGGRVTRTTKPVQLRRDVEAEIRNLFGRTATPLSTDLRSLLARCLELMEREKQIDRDLAALARANDVCRRFMEIPGVGPICALTFYAAVGEPTRFRKSSDIGPYLGLTPTLYQSGLTRRSGRISKMGNREARGLLVTASMRFRFRSGRHTQIHLWARSIEQRQGRFKARVALARKLATVMLAMWKKGECYRPIPDQAIADDAL